MTTRTTTIIDPKSEKILWRKPALDCIPAKDFIKYLMDKVSITQLQMLYRTLQYRDGKK